MGEYISREAARPDSFCEGVSCQDCPFCKDPVQGGCRIDDFVKSIPAADVKPVKRGEWIGYPECLKYPNAYADTHIVCSVCEECFSVLDNDTERFDFCPHCGAVMEGWRDGTA